MSKFIINIDGSIEQDKVFLCDRLLRKKCEIAPIDDLKTEMHLNSNDEVSFTLYKNNNGVFNPFWDKIDDIAIILVEGKGYFEISAPKTNDGAVFKQISGISLGEAETGQTNLTIDINSDDDLTIHDYEASVIYNPNKKDISILDRVFSVMPHYSIGHVDDSIRNLKPTLSCSDSNVHDFLNQIAEEIECIFIFDNFSRTVSCYDLKDHCTNPACVEAGDHRDVVKGVCQHCNSSDHVQRGYGENTGVFIDGTDDVSETITITGDKDSVKNCIKIEGADDIITDRIGSRLIGGNRIWHISDYQKSQMSDTLQRAMDARNSLVASYQNQYDTLWKNMSQCIDKISYYQSAMMPSADTDETTAETVYNEIFGTNAKITYGCISNKYVTVQQLTNSILKFAKLIAPPTYTVELTNVSNTTALDDITNVINSITLKAHIYLTNEYEDDGTTLKDEYTSANFTLPVKKGYNLYVSSDNNTLFTNDYYMYLRQQVEIAMAESDVSDDVITFDPPINDSTPYNSSTTPLLYANYDNETNSQHLPSIHYTMYSINRLQSFYDAYEACSAVIAEKNADIASNDTDDATTDILKYVTVNGNQESIFEALLGKYHKYMECISTRMKYLENKVKTLETQRDSYDMQIKSIQKECDMQTFLKNYENGSHGDDLWIELCSFRREDTYKNENYIGEDIDEVTLMENVDGLIKQANIEIRKACEINYTVTATIANLLTMKSFESFWDKIELGNYIRMRVDEDIYTLRLITMSFDYTDLAHCTVEFSDAVKNKISAVNKISEILKQAQSMGSSYNFVTKQAEKGGVANAEFQKIKNEGLDIANTMITATDNQEFVINRYGIIGRKWDDALNAFGDEQVRISTNLICFTTDAWKHTATAIGKICYYDTDTGEYKWDYGLNTGVLIGDLVISNKMRIINSSGTYTIDDNGFKMTNGNKYIYFDPSKPSVVFNNGIENLLDFNSDGEGKLSIGNGITLDSSGNATFSGKITASEININDKFVVDKNGNMTATSGSFTGTINSTNATITGGTINIETSGEQDSKIKTKHGRWTNQMSPIGMYIGNSDNNMSLFLQADGLWVAKEDKHIVEIIGDKHIYTKGSILTDDQIQAKGDISSDNQIQAKGSIFTDDKIVAKQLVAGDYIYTDYMLSIYGGNAYISGSLSAETIIDRTPYYDGNALEELSRVKDDGNGGIDHSTLPKFAQIKINQEVNNPKSGTSDCMGIVVNETLGKKRVVNTQDVLDNSNATSMELQREVKTKEVQQRASFQKSIDGIDDIQNSQDIQETIVKEVEGRDIGAMVSVLTKAIQQLISKNEEQDALIEDQSSQIKQLQEGILNVQKIK